MQVVVIWESLFLLQSLFFLFLCKKDKLLFMHFFLLAFFFNSNMSSLLSFSPNLLSHVFEVYLNWAFLQLCSFSFLSLNKKLCLAFTPFRYLCNQGKANYIQAWWIIWVMKEIFVWPIHMQVRLKGQANGCVNMWIMRGHIDNMLFRLWKSKA